MASEDRITPIEDLRAGMKNVHCIFIVIDRGTQQKTKDGSTVRKCRVADKTGSIIFSVWNREGEAISTGDIIRLTKGYSSLWKGNLVLYCGKYGLVERLGDFTMVFSETPDMSTYVPPQAEGLTQQSPHSMPEMSSSSAQPPSIENHHQSSNAKHRHSIETMATVSAPSSSSSPSTHSNGHMNSKHAQRRHPTHDNHVTSHHNNALSVHHRHHPYSRQNTREHGWQ
ncbi:PREDICTED: SOSS complex subunit B1-like [Amphimedon queenslandica]|uniref:Single-stranded DNA binding protein Ssb-like OB fold domain-containing protein n=1 Tax=Amphimedon queenslandica TaxID=400682 RepID=A0A1X7VS36_AMPQE|nr:PREDICTED: SOSS complex subunit B1-like [Amphimedon queenslandica]|eukprot:XP_003383005.1 PREDICTED: SOSS complex subunit B1-like [Amphimedon queenslandica]